MPSVDHLPAAARPTPAAGSSGERPIRVLHYLFFPRSGIARYAHEVLRHLGPDVSVELVCLPSYEWREQASYAVWPHLREIGHRRLWRRKVRFLIGQYANPRRLFQRVTETGAEIVHLSNINYLTFPLWRRWLDASGVKLVATAHDVRRQNSLIHRGYEDRQLQRFYQRADALLVHSQAQVADLQDFAGVDPSRVHIVPHGPYDYGRASASRQEIRARMGLPQNKRVALFFGRIRDEKNLALLLEAMVPFRDSLHLLIAGNANVPGHLNVTHYQGIIDRLHLSDSVTFLTQYIPESEVADLFAASDWSAMPYGRAFTSQSGVLNVAMQYQLPVLAGGAPTFAETYAGLDLGVLVEPDSLEALRSGIQELHRQLDAGHQYQFAEYLRQNSWDENVRRTVSVYRALLS